MHRASVMESPTRGMDHIHAGSDVLNTPSVTGDADDGRTMSSGGSREFTGLPRTVLSTLTSANLTSPVSATSVAGDSRMFLGAYSDRHGQLPQPPPPPPPPPPGIPNAAPLSSDHSPRRGGGGGGGGGGTGHGIGSLEPGSSSSSSGPFGFGGFPGFGIGLDLLSSAGSSAGFSSAAATGLTGLSEPPGLGSSLGLGLGGGGGGGSGFNPLFSSSPFGLPAPSPFPSLFGGTGSSSSSPSHGAPGFQRAPGPSRGPSDVGVIGSKAPGAPVSRPIGPGPIGPRSASSTGANTFDLGLEVATGGLSSAAPTGLYGSPGVSPLQGPSALPGAVGAVGGGGGALGAQRPSQSFFEQSFFTSSDLMADDPLEPIEGDQ